MKRAADANGSPTGVFPNIAWGMDPNNLTNTMDLAWSGYAWMQATHLTPGLWYFSIRSYNSSGAESPAVVISKTIG